MDGQAGDRFIANGGLQPVTLFLDVYGDEPADVGYSSAVARSDGGPAFLECRIGAQEPQRGDLEGDLAARGVLERGGELVTNGGTTLGALTLLVDDQGPRGESRGGCPGIAGIESFRERLEQSPDGLLVGGAILRGRVRILALRSNRLQAAQDRS